MVRIASFLIERLNRKTLSIINECYYFYEFDNSGKLDKKKYFERLSRNTSAILFDTDDEVFEDNFAYALKEYHHDKTNTQFQWFPSPSLKENLSKQIFK